MKQRNNLNSELTRRNWMVLATSALTGCGGGGIDIACTPGTGGTGQTAQVYSQGSISGFGSVIVNGVKYDDSKAVVQVDGVTVTSADLRLGMVAGVQGELMVDGVQGTASRIEVLSIAQGLVTQLNVPGEFMLAGLSVKADTATVLDQIDKLDALAVGQRLAVWGFQSGTDGRHWTATRVAVVTDTLAISTGLITIVNSQKTLNGWLLAGSGLTSLTAGQLVWVQGTLTQAGTTLNVTNFKVLTPGLGARSDEEVEIEGVVTSTPSSSGFMLGSIQVILSNSTTYSSASALTQVVKDARVEVYGTWQNGTLKASKVEIEDALSLHAVEIEARIEQFTSLADFVVRGQRCDATNARFSHGTSANLKVGVKVKFVGAKAGDVLIVTELAFDN